MHDQNGHRERVKDRFRKEGLDSFEEVHALELLLFYVLPRVDTKPLARTLLDRFGSYPMVMEASREELMAVPGVGESVATFLQLIGASARYYERHRNDTPTILKTAEACGKYLKKQFLGCRNETVFLLCLDAKCRLLSCAMIGEGDVNSANIPIRRLVEVALASNASAVILAHNHPGGLALPSAEDVHTTNHLSATLSAMSIVLLDHMIIADNDAISLAESGFYRPPKF